MLRDSVLGMLRFFLLTSTASLTLVASSSAQPARLTPGPELGDYIVKPSVTSSTLCQQENTIPVDIFCHDAFSGALVNDCNIQITFRAVDLSGWHAHTHENRPLGTFDRTSGISGSGTNPTGRLRLMYTAPEVAGEIKVTATGTMPNGDPIIPTEFPVFTIRFDFGWLFVWPDSNYTLTGETQWHPENHFGKISLIDAIVRLSNWYAGTYPGYKLAINDMSLPDGGLLDICVDPRYHSNLEACPLAAGSVWKPSHKAHRCGLDVDVDPVARAHQLVFKQRIKTDTKTWPWTTDHGGNHWHLRRALAQN